MQEGLSGARSSSSNRGARWIFNGQKYGQKYACRSGLQDDPAACPGGRLVKILRRSAPCIKLVRLEKRHATITALYIDVQMGRHVAYLPSDHVDSFVNSREPGGESRTLSVYQPCGGDVTQY